jgi:hypothetical protein
VIYHSKTIVSFIHYLESLVREIFEQEILLPLKTSRFHYKNCTYPLSIVVFEDPKKLGFFDADLYRIGINKNLMKEANRAILKDILRHELAHYFCLIDFGSTLQDHGEEFKSTCQRFQFSSAVASATLDLSTALEEKIGDLKSDELISKVKKLLSLATSENVHEAELATLKANQLILKHNIQFYELNEEQELVSLSILRYARNNAKLQAIYEIIKTFLVYPVFNYGKNYVYLEVTGTKSNVELAQYIAEVLDQSLEKLWDQTELKGLKAKNSFFTGVAYGYKEKQNTLKKEQSDVEQKALVQIESNLSKEVRFYFKRLSQLGSEREVDKKAHAEGIKAGKKLSIHQGLTQKTKTFLLGS